jgi:hypothetical protein
MAVSSGAYLDRRTSREKKMNAYTTWKVLAVALVLAVGMAAPASSGAKKEVRGARDGRCEVHCAPPENRWCNIECKGNPNP